MPGLSDGAGVDLVCGVMGLGEGREGGGGGGGGGGMLAPGTEMLIGREGGGGRRAASDGVLFGRGGGGPLLVRRSGNFLSSVLPCDRSVAVNGRPVPGLSDGAGLDLVCGVMGLGEGREGGGGGGGGMLVPGTELLKGREG